MEKKSKMMILNLKIIELKLKMPTYCKKQKEIRYRLILKILTLITVLVYISIKTPKIIVSISIHTASHSFATVGSPASINPISGPN